MAGVKLIADDEVECGSKVRFRQRRWTAPDPLQTVSFPHSGRSAKLNFCKLKSYRAAIGELTQPAKKGRSGKCYIAAIHFEVRSEPVEPPIPK